MEEINKKDPNGPEKTSKIETARSNNVDNNRKLKVTVIVLAVIAAVPDQRADRAAGRVLTALDGQ